MAEWIASLICFLIGCLVGGVIVWDHYLKKKRKEAGA